MKGLLLVLTLLTLTACQQTIPKSQEASKTASNLSSLETVSKDSLPTAYFEQNYAHLIDLQALIKQKRHPP